MRKNTPNDLKEQPNYRAPKLRLYGDLAKLTGTAANTMEANADGGSGSRDKTH